MKISLLLTFVEEHFANFFLCLAFLVWIALHDSLRIIKSVFSWLPSFCCSFLPSSLAYKAAKEKDRRKKVARKLLHAKTYILHVRVGVTRGIVSVPSLSRWLVPRFRRLRRFPDDPIHSYHKCARTMGGARKRDFAKLLQFQFRFPIVDASFF